MTNRRHYCVCNSDGIPFGEQDFSTITEAMARYNREVNEAVKLFGIDKKQAERMFTIMDMKTGKTIL